MKRRGFLAAAAAAALARPSVGSAPPPAPARGVVVEAVYASDPPEDRALLERGIETLFGAPIATATLRLAGEKDRIGIKLNTLAGPRLSPRPALASALCAVLQAGGVRADRIVLFDRSSRELERAGYTIRHDGEGVRCYGTDAIKGGGYGEEILEHRSIGSCFTRILTQHATVLINVGVLKDHDLSGVSAGAKNLYGLIHNPNRYHANTCDPYVADLMDHPAVRTKLRLIVIDALDAQCHGGPAHNPAFMFAARRLLIATDPVAIERVAWKRIEEERARRGLPSLGEEKRAPRWIASAAALGLGEADIDRIEIRRVEG